MWKWPHRPSPKAAKLPRNKNRNKNRNARYLALSNYNQTLTEQADFLRIRPVTLLLRSFLFKIINLKGA